LKSPRAIQGNPWNIQSELEGDRGTLKEIEKGKKESSLRW
jgi:hypothetical protein